MDNKISSVTGIYDGVVCAYACPDTDFRSEPFTVPDFGKLSPNTFKISIEDFKKRFKDLFIEMEEVHGKCLSVALWIERTVMNVNIWLVEELLAEKFGLTVIMNEY